MTQFNFLLSSHLWLLKAGQAQYRPHTNKCFTNKKHFISIKEHYIILKNSY